MHHARRRLVVCATTATLKNLTQWGECTLDPVSAIRARRRRLVRRAAAEAAENAQECAACTSWDFQYTSYGYFTAGFPVLLPAFTIEAWVMRQQVSTKAPGYFMTLATGTNDKCIELNEEGLVPGRWTHIAIVQDSNALRRRVYVNGALYILARARRTSSTPAAATRRGQRQLCEHEAVLHHGGLKRKSEFYRAEIE